MYSIGTWVERRKARPFGKLLMALAALALMAVGPRAQAAETDCNSNGVADSQDIGQGTSQDCNNNGIPDECETADCPPLEIVFVVDTSGSMLDEASQVCSKISGIISDLQGRGIEVIPTILNVSNDEDGDGAQNPEASFSCIEGSVLETFPVSGEEFIVTNEDWSRGMKVVALDKVWTEGAVRMVVGISDEDPDAGNGCNVTDETVVDLTIIEGLAHDVIFSVIIGTETGALPADADRSCIAPLAQKLADETGGSTHQTTDSVQSIADAFAAQLEGRCDPSNDCNQNGIPDDCEPDCNNNGVPDDCDIANGTSEDCNENGIPDECEPDCNGNGIPDDCDIAEGRSQDCNNNGVPDECDIGCEILEPTPGANGAHGDVILGLGQSQDCNQNGVPDECELENNDCNNNGIPDDCDINGGIRDCDVPFDPISSDDNNNQIPDECEPQEPIVDCNNNGVADDIDIVTGESEDANQNGVPDECEVDCDVIPEVTCPPVDLVIIMDTSSSMDPESAQLCAELDEMLDLFLGLGVDVRPVLLGITENPGGDFACLEGNVVERYGAAVPDPFGTTIRTIDKNEDWGDAIAVVAAHHNWTPGATRLIVPISDEDPQQGDGCDLEDQEAISNAIKVSRANGVIVSPILADSSNVREGNDLSCLLEVASRAAAETGGIVVELSDDLAVEVTDGLQSILLDICGGDQDCNDNGILDFCDIRDGVAEDCNENGVPDECEIALNPSIDADQDGVIDSCGPGEPGGECDFTGERLVDFTVQGTAGGSWTSQVWSGTGIFVPTPAEGSGLCMEVPATGENLVGWKSPRQWIELKDQTAYRVRLTMSTTQSDPTRIPMWTLDYDNFSVENFQINYGGHAWFLSVDGAANGIGAPSGRTSYDVWIMPNAVSTPQWRGTAGDGTTGAFAPEADAVNDMRVMIRTLDFDSNGIGSELDSGTICIERIEVESILLPCLETCDAEPAGDIINDCILYQAPISSNNHRFLNIEGAGTQTTFDNTNSLARIVLDTTAGRASLKPGGPETPEARHPVVWEANTLYEVVLEVQAAEDATEDPLDMLQVIADTRNSELGVVHWSLRGAEGGGPGAMFRAASPRKASVAGGAQEYKALFYSHNVTASPLATSARFRPSGDFFNTTDLYGTGTGGDALEVVGMKVRRLQLPAE